MNEHTRRRIAHWQKAPFDGETIEQIKYLSQNDPKALEDAFYTDLTFGTGGMRGIMGVGTNRINRYTIGRATQGLANYLKEKHPNETIKVVIAYDCRHQSDALAKVTADVLTANGIHVFLFESLRTTPALSFAVRYLSSHAGIVLTASHNPPKYNGYKVYNQYGGQIVPPEDKAIVKAIAQVDIKEVLFKGDDSLLEMIGEKVDDAFVEMVCQYGQYDKTTAKDLKVVFTPLHGTAITAVPDVLKKAGYDQVHIVSEQAKPDGDFPTVISPNPEDPNALKIALDTAKDLEADIVIGTDPDSDRLGIAIKDDKGNWTLLNGNQAMVLMTDYLLRQQSDLSNDHFIASTIVSTPMISKIADAYGVDCKLSLTGFKWIGQMINDFPEQDFIGGGEESFGYMVGDFVRDKDAVTATLLACEMAWSAKKNNQNLYDSLKALYKKHGTYLERLITVTLEGKEGMLTIEKKMNDLRDNPPQSIDGIAIKYSFDYLSGIVKNHLSHQVTPTGLPTSNVLIFEAEEGTRIAVRPSGTEPKIKYYISVNDQNYEETTMNVLESKIACIIKELKINNG